MPVLLAIGLAVALHGPGPVLFAQNRWGRHGNIIRIYKFRTMRADACDVTGTLQAVPGDSRVTPLGRVLRRSGLDELPQLFNVLKGDMSLVGPRCHPIGMQAGGVSYEALAPLYHRRHSVRPGLTGLAQIRGLRGPTANAARARARIRCDRLYVARMGFWLDLKILLETPAVLFSARGAC